MKYNKFPIIIAILLFCIAGYEIYISNINKIDISGIIVPHHDMVSEQRQQFMTEVASKIKQPDTIILVSPNHYETGLNDIQTNQQVWYLKSGDIQPDKKILDSIKGISDNDPISFNNEHGIKNILGDINNYFPKSKIVPIILKQSVTIDRLNQLNEILTKNCNNCLMISSVDFSHYQPALLANLHDNQTIRALNNIDEDAILNKSEVDSPATLTLLAKWTKSHNCDKFVLKNHTNSDIINNTPDMESTSHIFGWYQSGSKTVPENSVSFIVGGDMMFGRNISHYFLDNGLQTSLNQLGDRVFWGTDAGIINLEGPISAIPVEDNTDPDNVTFNFQPNTIQALKYLKVNAVSLANNHTLNSGQDGLDTTRRLLNKSGIQTIGDPENANSDYIGTFNGQNLKLYVFGVNEISTSVDISAQITEIKKDANNRVLVFAHWGTEYYNSHTDQQQQSAHSWIDAGADIVIGSHPHVIEDSEVYKGKPIIYSIGNLLFDQNFSEETQQGLLIAGEFKDNGLYLFALPVKSINYKPSMISDDKKAEVLDKLYEPMQDKLQKTEAGNIIFFNN